MDPDGSHGAPEPLEEDDLYPRRRWVWLRVIAAVAIVGLIALYGLRPAVRTNGAPAARADFSLPLLEGDGAIDDDTLRGRPVVVNFWASWCGPCRREMPLLSRMSRTYEDAGVLFVGIDVMDAPQSAREFLAEVPVAYPIVTDPEKVFVDALAVQGLPVTLFIEGDDGALDQVLSGDIEAGGEIALGELDEDELRAAIERLLSEEA